jgi:hypothetical protein
VNVGIKLFKIVPLILPFPRIRQMFRRNVVFVDHIQHSLLLLGVTKKICANEATVPSPVIPGIGRGMNTHKTAACLDVSFKCILLVVIQQRIFCVGSIKKHDRRIVLQRVFIEVRGIFCSVNKEVVVVSKLLDGGLPCWDRAVPESDRLREYQNSGFTGALVSAGKQYHGDRHYCKQRQIFYHGSKISDRRRYFDNLAPEISFFYHSFAGHFPRSWDYPQGSISFRRCGTPAGCKSKHNSKCQKLKQTRAPKRGLR